MLNKQIIEVIDNKWKIIEYEDILGNKLRAVASNEVIYSSTLIGEKKYELYYPYFYFYDYANLLNKNIKTSLVLGAGCFTYPKYYISKYNDKIMDCVEIDKKLIEIAYKYFYLDDLYKEFDPTKKRLKIFNEDAKKYIINCKKKYDYIFLDIFDNNEPIDTFLTQEFTYKIYSLLKKNGIYTINYIINNNKEKKISNYLKVLESNFKTILILSTKNQYKNKIGNICIFCSQEKINITFNDSKIIKIDINELK